MEQDQDLVRRVKSDPNYQKLVRTRSRYGWMLTISVLVVYYGFTCLNAFDKPFMSSKFGNGVMSWGIPLGLFVILFTIVVTGIYVRRANREFDALTDAIQRNAGVATANGPGAGNPGARNQERAA